MSADSREFLPAQKRKRQTFHCSKCKSEMLSDHGTGWCMKCREITCKQGHTFQLSRHGQDCPKCKRKTKNVSFWTEAPEILTRA